MKKLTKGFLVGILVFAVFQTNAFSQNQQIPKEVTAPSNLNMSRTDLSNVIGLLGQMDGICREAKNLDEAEWKLREIGPELLTIDREAVPNILEVVKDGTKDWKQRYFSIQVLTKTKDERVAPVLLVLLQDENERMEIRRLAARSLGILKEKSAVLCLMEFAKSQDEGMKISAIRALGNIADSSSINCLAKSLNDENWHVRINAANSLGNLNNAMSIPFLLQAYENEEKRTITNEYETEIVKMNILEALGTVPDKKSTEKLINVLENTQETSDVRKSAIDALGKLKDRESTDNLTNILQNNSDDGIRLHVVKALKKIEGNSAISIINQASENTEDEQIKQQIKAIINELQ